MTLVDPAIRTEPTAASPSTETIVAQAVRALELAGRLRSLPEHLCSPELLAAALKAREAADLHARIAIEAETMEAAVDRALASGKLDSAVGALASLQALRELASWPTLPPTDIDPAAVAAAVAAVMTQLDYASTLGDRGDLLAGACRNAGPAGQLVRPALVTAIERWRTLPADQQQRTEPPVATPEAAAAKRAYDSVLARAEAWNASVDSWKATATTSGGADIASLLEAASDLLGQAASLAEDGARANALTGAANGAKSAAAA
jgi:hypothetical protein